ncbi:MAG TPA: hypothetical protein VK130_09145 [Steroidobacteraceae bacterium]|nr:hypothetical protein [Steroidobacteraceae bacterium]
MSKYSRSVATATLVALLGALALGEAGCAVGFRVYDPEYGGYHYWDRHEEGVFRIYLEGRHEPYRKFRSLGQDRQREYWKWRHDRPDEGRRDGDRHDEDRH